VCDDGDMCTKDVCFPQVGCYAIEVCCDDYNACTVEECDPSSGCTYAPVDCDDNDPCTIDSCNPDNNVGCIHVYDPANLKRDLQTRCAQRYGA
jgi:hypothetical protein